MKRTTSRGFTLIELIIGIVILGVLLGLAAPAFSQWIRNTRLRNQAESVLYGLQQARGESIKRNAAVRFQLVDFLTNSCNLVTTNTNLWIVTHGDPTSKCGNPESLQNPDTTGNDPYSTTPVLLLKGRQENQNTSTTTLTVTAPGVATPNQIVCFDGLGRLQRLSTSTGLCIASSNPGTTATPSVQINVTDPSTGTCAASGGPVRCLRVNVSSTGETRICDPAVTSTSDPRICS